MLQSSVTRLQKIDMMLSLMPLHSKRLHCILDVSQTSLRSQQAGQQGPPPHRDGMDFRPVVIVGNVLERLDVLIQRAAQHGFSG